MGLAAADLGGSAAASANRRSDRVDQVGRTVTVGAGSEELGASCGAVDEGRVAGEGAAAGVLAAVGEVLARGVGNGFGGRGLVRGI
jgi:hypothetical protein